MISYSNVWIVCFSFCTFDILNIKPDEISDSFFLLQAKKKKKKITKELTLLISIRNDLFLVKFIGVGTCLLLYGFNFISLKHAMFTSTADPSSIYLSIHWLLVDDDRRPEEIKTMLITVFYFKHQLMKIQKLMKNKKTHSIGNLWWNAESNRDVWSEQKKIEIEIKRISSYIHGMDYLCVCVWSERAARWNDECQMWLR